MDKKSKLTFKHDKGIILQFITMCVLYLLYIYKIFRYNKMTFNIE